jgi:sialic acid synthase SpsE
VQIESFNILPRHKVFIIAEAVVNHNGRLETAKQLVRGAKAVGLTQCSLVTMA